MSSIMPWEAIEARKLLKKAFKTWNSNKLFEFFGPMIVATSEPVQDAAISCGSSRGLYTVLGHDVTGALLQRASEHPSLPMQAEESCGLLTPPSASNQRCNDPLVDAAGGRGFSTWHLPRWARLAPFILIVP